MVRVSLPAMGTSLVTFVSNQLVFNILNLSILAVFVTLLLMRWLRKLVLWLEDLLDDIAFLVVRDVH